MFAKYMTAAPSQENSVQQLHISQLLILLKKSLFSHDFVMAAKLLSVLSRSSDKIPEVVAQVSRLQ